MWSVRHCLLFVHCSSYYLPVLCFLFSKNKKFFVAWTVIGKTQHTNEASQRWWHDETGQQTRVSCRARVASVVRSAASAHSLADSDGGGGALAVNQMALTATATLATSLLTFGSSSSLSPSSTVWMCVFAGSSSACCLLCLSVEALKETTQLASAHFESPITINLSLGAMLYYCACMPLSPEWAARAQGDQQRQHSQHQQQQKQPEQSERTLLSDCPRVTLPTKPLVQWWPLLILPSQVTLLYISQLPQIFYLLLCLSSERFCAKREYEQSVERSSFSKRSNRQIIDNGSIIDENCWLASLLFNNSHHWSHCRLRSLQVPPIHYSLCLLVAITVCITMPHI